VDTSLWDLGSMCISGVIYVVEHIRYRVVHDDTWVCISIQLCTVVYTRFLE
jgi:hypothetical protein